MPDKDTVSFCLILLILMKESGPDCWKTYMRRQTNTINWGGEIHLAQGVEFHP